MSVTASESTVPPAVIVAGMHRSGTSLAASILADSGVHLGDAVMGPGEGNPEGHFEDLEILAFHRHILAANGLGTDGFTAQREISVPPAVWPESRRLVAARRSRGLPWGWKEPRTTLFLDHWAEAVPEARFLLLFRRPWEVVDSLFRRGDLAFALHPPLTIAVWRRYNEAIRDFHERHPDRCLLVETAQLTADREWFASRLCEVFGVEAAGGSSRFKPGLMVEDPDSSRAGLLAATDEEAFDLYLDLRSRAGSRSSLPALAEARGQMASFALREWQRAAAAERRAIDCQVRASETTAHANAQAAAHAAALSEARAAAAAELRASQGHLRDANDLIVGLQAHTADRHAEIAELRRLLEESRHEAVTLAARLAKEVQRRQEALLRAARSPEPPAPISAPTSSAPPPFAAATPRAWLRRFSREGRRLGKQIERVIRTSRDRILGRCGSGRLVN